MGAEPKTRTLKLKNITVDPAIQSRAAGLDEGTVEEYAELMRAGVKFPPVRVYRNAAGSLWLAQGFHRFEAASRAGLAEIDAEVVTGERADADFDSAGANKDHGLRRTNRDKRRAVEKALKSRPNLSDRAVADHVGVSDKFVGKVRAEVRTVRTCDEPDTRVGTDGKTYTVKPKADPKPAPKPDETTAGGPGEERVPETVGGPNYGVERVEGDGGEQPDEPVGERPAAVEHAPPAPTVVKPPPAVDAWGVPIQDHAAEAFKAVPEFKRLAGLLREARGALTALCEAPGGRQLLRRCQYHKAGGKDGGRWVLAELDNALRTIEDTTPKHTDCPYHFNDLQPHPKPGDPGRPCPLCDGYRFTGTFKQFQVPPNLLAAMKAHYGVAEGD